MTMTTTQLPLSFAMLASPSLHNVQLHRASVSMPCRSRMIFVTSWLRSYSQPQVAACLRQCRRTLLIPVGLLRSMLLHLPPLHLLSPRQIMLPPQPLLPPPHPALPCLATPVPAQLWPPPLPPSLPQSLCRHPPRSGVLRAPWSRSREHHRRLKHLPPSKMSPLVLLACRMAPYAAILHTQMWWLTHFRHRANCGPGDMIHRTPPLACGSASMPFNGSKGSTSKPLLLDSLKTSVYSAPSQTARQLVAVPSSRHNTSVIFVAS